MGPDLTPLARVGAVLVVAGLAFKVAAVPFHAWAAAYDGARCRSPRTCRPPPSWAGGRDRVRGRHRAAALAGGGGPPLAAIAVLTMTVGNLVALRQRRMVRLLAWSSVAQAGYLLAPLGGFAVAAGRTGDVVALALTATVAYTIFYV